MDAPHPDMAQHTTTYSLLKQLLPLATCPADELQSRLDQVTEQAFVAGAVHGVSSLGSGSQSGSWLWLMPAAADEGCL